VNGYFLNYKVFLCLIYDKKEHLRFLLLFDGDNYDLVFKYEICVGIQNYITFLNDYYLNFETNSGYIGLEFNEKVEAKGVYDCLKKDFEKKFDKNKKDKKRLEIIRDILRKKFIQHYNLNISNIVNLKHINPKEGFDISLPSLYNIFENISFNQSKFEYNVEVFSNRLIYLFGIIGIKKSELINSGFNSDNFKLLIQEYENYLMDKKEKFVNLSKNDGKTVSLKEKHYYTKLKPKIYFGNNSCFLESKKENNISIANSNISSSGKNVPKIPITPSVPNFSKAPNVPISSKVPNIPSVPNIPNLPNVPKLPDNISKLLEESKNNVSIPTQSAINQTNNSNKPNIVNIGNTITPKDTNTNINASLAQQIGNVKLKKIDWEDKSNQKQPLKSCKSLQEEIQKRRFMIEKFKADSESEEDDWSDDNDDDS